MQKASAVLHSLPPDGNHSRNIRTVQEAVLKRDVKRVREILHNCKNEQVIRSALCSAVTLDETSMLQSILDQIKHSNMSDNLYKRKHCQSDTSPLHVACSQGKEDSVSLLLIAGFTANVLDEYNSTPLFWAIYKKHRSVADILLSIDDIDVNSVLCDLPPSCHSSRSRYWDKTVLMWASSIGDFQSIIGICRHSPFPNVVDDRGETPLHKVCWWGNINCVLSLLSCGAEVDARDAHGETPLYGACRYGRTDIVEVLLQSGAQINQKYNGYSYELPPLLREWNWEKLLLFAAIGNRRPEVVSLLISYGANIDIKIHDTVTPLHFACSEGTLGIVKTLVNNGSCINAKTYSGQTPLFYCLRDAPGRANVHGYPGDFHNRYSPNLSEGYDIMEYLIKQGATLSCKDDSGRTPLEHAMMTYRGFSTLTLLKYGGRISGEHLDKFPWTESSWSRDMVPNIYLFLLLLRSNFEFRISAYLEKESDLKSKGAFLKLLKEVEKPLSLKDQCRISIRNMISTDTGVQFISSINTLGLPKLLQGFLMFDDIDDKRLRF